MHGQKGTVQDACVQCGHVRLTEGGGWGKGCMVKEYVFLEVCVYAYDEAKGSVYAYSMSICE